MAITLLSLLGAVPAHAAVAPGDVLVADLGFKGLLRVDPATGRASPFAANTDPVNAASQLFSAPADVTVAPSGLILVADTSAFGTGGVISVDPETGKQTKLSANDLPVNSASQLFQSPSGIDLLPSGRILVVDRYAFGFEGGVIAVDPVTGRQSVFSSNEQNVNVPNPLFGDLRGGIEVLPDGAVLVGNNGSAVRGVLGLDPATGKQSVWSSNVQAVNAASSFYEIPVDPLYTASGDLFVADQNAFGDGGVVGVDPPTGKQSKVSANDQPVNAGSGYFSDPFDLAMSPDGRIIVADASAFGGTCSEGCGGLIAVDPATGRQQVFSNNAQPLNVGDLPFDNPLGVAVVPLRCQGEPVTIMGTPGAERIDGTAGADVIASQGGLDRILGLGGADLICGGGGADVIKSGQGSDRVRGGAGRDRLLGGPARDRLWGDAGRDRLFGGPGPDVLKGGKGADLLRGGPGRDRERK